MAIGTTVAAEADTALYSLDALKKAAYRIADRCTVVFGSRDQNKVAFEFMFGTTTTADENAEAQRAFFEAATDYDLRERIAADTAPLRNLILAHAFSRTKLIDGAG